MWRKEAVIYVRMGIVRVLMDVAECMYWAVEWRVTLLPLVDYIRISTCTPPYHTTNFTLPFMNINYSLEC